MVENLLKLCGRPLVLPAGGVRLTTNVNGIQAAKEKVEGNDNFDGKLGDDTKSKDKVVKTTAFGTKPVHSKSV